MLSFDTMLKFYLACGYEQKTAQSRAKRYMNIQDKWQEVHHEQEQMIVEDMCFIQAKARKENER